MYIYIYIHTHTYRERERERQRERERERASHNFTLLEQCKLLHLSLLQRTSPPPPNFFSYLQLDSFYVINVVADWSNQPEPQQEQSAEQLAFTTEGLVHIYVNVLVFATTD